MPNISAMRAQLARMRHTIVGSPVFTSGRANDPTKATEEAMQLDRMASHVALILRELGSAESVLRIRAQQLRNIPHEDRYSAQQSIKQQTEDVQLLRGEAQSMAELILKVLDRNGLLNPIQRAKSLLDLVGDLKKVVGHDAQALVAQALHASKQPVISPEQVVTPRVDMGGVLNLLVFVFLGLRVARDRLRESKQTGV